jgi:hypothetical protein
MENREPPTPPKEDDTDITKAQTPQQPASFGEPRKTPPPTDEVQSQLDEDQAESTGQAGFGETATDQRNDVEGSSLDQPEESQAGFVGSNSTTDSSSELIEDEDEHFRKDGQGVPEGK